MLAPSSTTLHAQKSRPFPLVEDQKMAASPSLGKKGGIYGELRIKQIGA
jgi:hypothetical protein